MTTTTTHQTNRTTYLFVPSHGDAHSDIYGVLVPLNTAFVNEMTRLAHAAHAAHKQIGYGFRHLSADSPICYYVGHNYAAPYDADDDADDTALPPYQITPYRLADTHYSDEAYSLITFDDPGTDPASLENTGWRVDTPAVRVYPDGEVVFFAPYKYAGGEQASDLVALTTLQEMVAAILPPTHTTDGAVSSPARLLAEPLLAAVVP